MSILDSVKEALTSQPETKSRPDDGSKGAYWCDDCGVRIRDVELEGEPVCPDCGEEMRFERAAGRDCAC
ncbi:MULTISPECIES: hypothetical protein [Haloarcula]|uniref:Small CPxCG-related zinc finger protein n=3 Tax=Haloarcula TaxID=2237 RepID=A0A847UI61_HALAR|nr:MULTISPECIES: hypothetical protein [Haloarcula]MDQ2073755.1 hypothetical protein [Haloarcula sp. H-GB4]NLV13109.1 hypothetical protein [Haloarcula argentinensis]GGK58080.1 hypothetical protein GCM10009067_08200 [Haloarcula sebkhae]GGM38175.1 hypothetical protein GCM10009006_19170 [Haloarcula argentinensis]